MSYGRAVTMIAGPVGVAGFEPTTFRSQSGRATKLRHTPNRYPAFRLDRACSSLHMDTRATASILRSFLSAANCGAFSVSYRDGENAAGGEPPVGLCPSGGWGSTG